MARPRTLPNWATSTNFTATEPTDPHDGTPTKVEPSSGQKANGFEPRYRVPAQFLNWLLSVVTTWVAHLAPIDLANWFVRAFDTTSTPTAGTAVAARTYVGELDAMMAIFTTAGNGIAQRSPDGVRWTNLAGGLAAVLYDIAWMGGSVNRWLIAAAGGVIYHHASNTGGNWTAVGPGSGDNFRAVAANAAGDLAIAVGDNGRLYSSINGTAWTSRTSGTAEDLRDVATGNGRWVAVGTGLTIITSTDGTTWSMLATGAGTLTHVVYVESDDCFLVFSSAGAVSRVSSSGVVSSGVGSIGAAPTAVASDGATMAIAITSVALRYSTDAGVTWSPPICTTQGVTVLASFTGLARCPGLGCFIAVGEDGAVPGPLVAQSLRTS